MRFEVKPDPEAPWRALVIDTQGELEPKSFGDHSRARRHARKQELAFSAPEANDAEAAADDTISIKRLIELLDARAGVGLHCIEHTDNEYELILSLERFVDARAYERERDHSCD